MISAELVNFHKSIDESAVLSKALPNQQFFPIYTESDNGSVDIAIGLGIKGLLV